MTLTDRRRSRRRPPAMDEPLSRVRLRAGRELLVLDVSAGGVLVESDVRLLPGTHVDVHVWTPDGRLLVRSRVVRAYVSRLSAGGVTYRGAFAFDRSIESGTAGTGVVSPADVRPSSGGYGLPARKEASLAPTGTSYPEPAA